MSDTKKVVVYRNEGKAGMFPCPEEEQFFFDVYVTHADYGALEELRASDAECLSKVNDLLQEENYKLKEELAALRGKYQSEIDEHLDTIERSLGYKDGLRQIADRHSEKSVDGQIARDALRAIP